MSPRSLLQVVIVGVLGINGSVRGPDSALIGRTSPDTSALRFRSIVAGGDHTCGLTQEGRAFCWGSDEWGALGIGGARRLCAQPPWSRIPPGHPDFMHFNDIPPRPCALRPTPVAGGIQFRILSAGRDQTCAVSTDSLAYCWGSNWSGQLGVVEAPDLCDAEEAGAACARAPVQVSGDLRFLSISAGTWKTCGLVRGGSLYCWGQIGQFAVAEGLWAHGTCPQDNRSNMRPEQKTLVERADSLVRLSGSPPNRELLSACTSVPTRVPADRSLVEVSVPYTLDSRGALYVLWQHAVRLSVVDGAGVPSPRLAKLAHGEEATCAIGSDSVAYCWANINAPERREPPNFAPHDPHPVAGRRHFIEVGGLLTDVCALTDAGVVYCSGINTDKVGVPMQDTCPTYTARVTPHGLEDTVMACNKSLRPLAATARRFQSIAVGYEHLCGLSAEGEAWCWGDNSAGQLATGDTTSQRRPTPVAGPIRARSEDLQPDGSAGTYRLQLTTEDSLKPLGVGKTITLDLEPGLIPLGLVRSVGSDTTMRSLGRQVPYPNACFFGTAGSPSWARWSGFAEWWLDSAGDSVDLVLVSGIEYGLTIRYPRGQPHATGSVRWWGHGPVARSIVGVETSPWVDVSGVVTVERTGPPDSRLCVSFAHSQREP